MCSSGVTSTEQVGARYQRNRARTTFAFKLCGIRPKKPPEPRPERVSTEDHGDLPLRHDEVNFVDELKQRGRRRRRVFGSFFFFFLFFLLLGSLGRWSAHALDSARVSRSSALTRRSSSCTRASHSATSICHLSASSSSSSSSAKFFWRRNRRVRPSMASAGASANDGTHKRGVSPEERRRLRSLLCGAGSVRLPSRTPGGGVFCASRPACFMYSTSSTSALAVFGSRGAGCCSTPLLVLQVGDVRLSARAIAID